LFQFNLSACVHEDTIATVIINHSVSVQSMRVCSWRH